MRNRRQIRQLTPDKLTSRNRNESCQIQWNCHTSLLKGYLYFQHECEHASLPEQLMWISSLLITQSVKRAEISQTKKLERIKDLKSWILSFLAHWSFKIQYVWSLDVFLYKFHMRFIKTDFLYIYIFFFFVFSVTFKDSDINPNPYIKMMTGFRDRKFLYSGISEAKHMNTALKKDRIMWIAHGLNVKC